MLIDIILFIIPTIIFILICVEFYKMFTESSEKKYIAIALFLTALISYVGLVLDIVLSILTKIN